MDIKQADPRWMDFVIRLSVVAALVVLCLQLTAPFLGPIAWGLVLAVGFQPLHQKLTTALRGRSKLAAAVIAAGLLGVLLVPVLLLGDSLVDGVRALAKGLTEGTLTVPPPPESVAHWPLIGGKLHGLWRMASDNLTTFLEAESVYLKDVGTRALGIVTGLAVGLGQFVLSVIIAAALLVNFDGLTTLARSIGVRLAGERGLQLSKLAAQTVRSVAVGVMGVAVLQSVLAGIGMLVAGVPAAGLLTLITLVLCVVQVGPGVVLIGTTIYLFSTGDTLRASLFLVWAIVILPLDNILKPIIFGRGVKAPMLIIFIGSLGGFLRSGIIGLFTGAVLLVLAYEVFRAWLTALPDAASGGGDATPGAATASVEPAAAETGAAS